MLAAAMIAVLLVITVGATYVAVAVVARHRAQAAADLAALAAAARVTQGADAACRQAASVTAAMQARTTECAVDQLDVVVTVEVPVTFGRFGGRSARAVARAGPADTAG